MNYREIGYGSIKNTNIAFCRKPVAIPGSNHSLKRPVLFLLSILTFVIVRDFFNVSVNIIIFPLITVLFILVSNKEDIICYAVILIPLVESINFGTVIGILAIAYLFKSNLKIKISPLFVLPILLLVIEFLHISIKPFDIEAFIAYACVYLFLAFVLASDNKNIDAARIVKTFIVSVLLTNLLILLFALQRTSFDISQVISNNIRIGSVLNDTNRTAYILNNNPNNIAMMCCVAIASLLSLFFAEKISIKAFLPFLFLLLAIGLMTISRSFLVSMIFAVLLLVLSVNKKSRKLSYKIFYIILAALLLLLIINPDIIVNSIARLLRAEDENTTYSRSYIFQEYMKYMSGSISRVIWGIGCQSQNIKSGIYFVTHNSIQDVYVSWGLVGLIAALYYLFSLFRKYCSKFYYRWSYIPFLSMLFFSMSDRIFNASNTMVMLIVVCMVLKIGQEKQGYVKEEASNFKDTGEVFLPQNFK